MHPFTITCYTILCLLCFSCGEPAPIQVQSEESASSKPVGKVISFIEDAELEKLGIENREDLTGGLKVGDLAPEFLAKNQHGDSIALSNHLKKGPVVITFYRGHWCGYCNRHLEEFAQNHKAIKTLGAEVIAISPEISQNTLKTIEKNKLAFDVISDADNAIMQKFKLDFSVNDAYQKKINTKLETDIATCNNQQDAKLPVPATYIIGQDRKVAYAFYHPNYSKRAEMTDILAHLSSAATN